MVQDGLNPSEAFVNLHRLCFYVRHRCIHDRDFETADGHDFWTLTRERFKHYIVAHSVSIECIISTDLSNEKEVTFISGEIKGIMISLRDASIEMQFCSSSEVILINCWR